MTGAVQNILNCFDRLSEREQIEVAAEIFRRSKQLESLPITDNELVALADELFLELDRQEAGE